MRGGDLDLQGCDPAWYPSHQMKERLQLPADHKSFPEVVGDSAFLLGLLLLRARFLQASQCSFVIFDALCTASSVETPQDHVFTQRLGSVLPETHCLRVS